jgi:hypothetical protein
MRRIIILSAYIISAGGNDKFKRNIQRSYFTCTLPYSLWN